MTLLWAVPVVAAAVATLLVVAHARPLEDEAVALVGAVRRLREVRAPLGAVRATVGETDAAVAAFRDRHAPPAPGGDGHGATDADAAGADHPHPGDAPAG